MSGGMKINTQYVQYTWKETHVTSIYCFTGFAMTLRLFEGYVSAKPPEREIANLV